MSSNQNSQQQKPNLFSNQAPQQPPNLFSNQLNSDPLLMNQAPQQNSYIPQQQQMPQNNLFSPPIYAQNNMSNMNSMNMNSMNMNSMYMNSFSPFSTSSSIQLLNNKEEDKDKKVVAVIITIANGVTYDNLFTSVQQQSQEGTKVQVYSCQAGYIEKLISAFDGKPEDETSTQMMNEIKELDADCVVFNW